jgi:hypothetical protein
MFSYTLGYTNNPVSKRICTFGFSNHALGIPILDANKSQTIHRGTINLWQKGAS